jgi:antitoxin component of MazEF toxin-antitoxin module
MANKSPHATQEDENVCPDGEMTPESHLCGICLAATRNVSFCIIIEVTMATPAKVKKWGSSMAVLIPSQFAKMRDIQVGSVIDLESVQVVNPRRRRRRRYKLSELLAGYKPKHRHGEWDLGVPVGKEIW